MPASNFDIGRVGDALRGTVFHGKLHHFTTIDSTNTRALADAQGGAEAGQVYVADEQTAGRGRGGHVWHSEPDRGLYVTVLLRPAIASQHLLHFSLATALAVQSAIMATAGYAADIRWPNDLVSRPFKGQARKLGGILAESALGADATLKHVVIGVGINLNQSEFPDDLATTATSLLVEAGVRTSREALLVSLLLELEAEMDRLQAEIAGTVTQPFLNGRFLLASTWVRGKRVHVAEDEGYTGTTAGLTRDGLLLVHCDDGVIRTVRHGGVREL